MRLYYRAKEVSYKLRKKWQRFLRGYAWDDVWNIDSWFMETLEPMLRHLAKNSHGYPMAFEDDKKWTEILLEMADCLHMMRSIKECEGPYKDMPEGKEKWEKETELYQKNKGRFFELFVKYFEDLWD